VLGVVTFARNFSARENEALDFVVSVSFDEADPVAGMGIEEITFQNFSQTFNGQDLTLKLAPNPHGQLEIRR
jgi:hypothetical protein